MISPVVPDVLEEHLVEIAFLSIQRRRLIFAPDVPLRGFLPHDERIAAHWDGLVVGLPATLEIALEKLEAFDPWEGYAAARVWLELGSPDTARIARRIMATDAELHGSWREILRRIPRARFQHFFPQIPSEPALAAILVFAAGWHDALTDSAAAAATFSTDSNLRLCAARAFGWSSSTAQAPALLNTLLRDPDEPVRRAALWSLAMMQPAAAAAQARAQLRTSEDTTFAARTLALTGVAEDMDLARRHLAAADEPWLFGEHFPWRGAAEETPMHALWRSLLAAPRPEFDWLRREVPDGFFADELREDAVPGE
jgi:hypothetical protein